MESDVITLQDIFKFEVEQVSPDRTVIGKLAPTGIHPMFLDKFRKRGVELPQGLFGKPPRKRRSTRRCVPPPTGGEADHVAEARSDTLAAIACVIRRRRPGRSCGGTPDLPGGQPQLPGASVLAADPTRSGPLGRAMFTSARTANR